MRRGIAPILVAVLILGAAGCAARRADLAPRPVLIADERVWRLEVDGPCLVAVGSAGETATAEVAGWYVLSPGRLARIGERLRRCPE